MGGFGRRMGAFDWWLTGGLLAASIALDSLAPGKWREVVLGFALPLYAVVEGFRLRRPWLAGGLAAGLTLGFILVPQVIRHGMGDPSHIGRTMRLWWARGTPGASDLAAPALGALGVVMGWIAAWLARPLPSAYLRQRMGAVMAADAFEDLGLASAAGLGEAALPSPETMAPRSRAQEWGLGPPTQAGGGGGEASPWAGWLEAEERGRAVERLLGALERLNLPRVGVTEGQVGKGSATIAFPNESCGMCAGTGAAVCRTCSGKGAVEGAGASGAAGACPGCGGGGAAACECLDVVSFGIPPEAPSGFVVRGECGDPSHRHYATIHGEALPRPRRPLPVLWMGILGIPAGIPIALAAGAVALEEVEFGAGLWALALGGALWAIAAIPMLLRARFGWWVMRASLAAFVVGGVVLVAATPAGIIGLLRGGMSLEGVVAQMTLLAAVVGAVGVLHWWGQAQVGVHFRVREDLARGVAPTLLPARDRVGRALTSAPARGLAVVGLAAVLTWLVLDSAAGHRWTMARAQVAARSGGGGQAVRLYEEAVREAPREDRPRAVRRANGGRLRMLEDAIAQEREEERRPWGAFDLAVLCESVSKSAKSLEKEEARRAAELMVACGDVAARRREWAEGKRVFAAVAEGFPKSPVTQELRNRSQWLFDSADRASRAKRVPVRPYVAKGGGSRIKLEHDYLHPGEGNAFLILPLHLAHIGHGESRLLASSLALADGEGRRFGALGMEEDDSAYGQDIHYLLTVCSYEGLGLGPEVRTARVVFEVPKGGGEFTLYLNGRPVTTVRAS